jgi:hypothetical protein
MSKKPADIPDDVWAAAMDAAAGLRNAVVWQSNSANEIIATCLASTRLDERERCAKAYGKPLELPPGTYGMVAVEAYWRGAADARDAMTTAIRNPSPAADPTRAANSSPAALDAASNDDFATIPHLGDVS